MASSAGTAYVTIKPDFGSFSRDLGKGIKQAGGGLQSFGRTLTRSVTLPLVGIGTAASVMGIKTASSLEQSEIAFKTFYGSTEAAQAVMEDLADFAATTPFDLPGITDASKKLASVGVASEDLIPIMTGVGDAVAGVGGSAQQIEQVAFAMQQVIGQGRAMTQDINQIASTGIPIWGELAAQMGVGEAEIRDLASQGKITDEVLQAAFTNPVGPLTTFSGLMEEQSGTLAGQWSTLVDTINIELAEAFQEALPSIKEGLAQLIDAIGPALQAAGPAFAALIDAMVPIVGIVADLLTWFAALSPEMQRFGIYTLAAAAAAGPVIGIFGRFVSAIGGLVKVAGKLSTFGKVLFATARVFGVFKGLAKIGTLFLRFGRTIALGIKIISIAFVTSPIGLIITAIVAAIALAGYLIYRNWETIKQAFAAAWAFIQPILMAIWQGIQTAFGFAVGVFQAVWDAIWGFVQGLVSVIAPVFSTFFAIITLPIRIWWAVMSTVFQLAWALVKWLFETIVGFVVPIWEALWEKVSSVVEAAWRWIRDTFTKVWSFIKDIFTKVKGTIVSVWNTIYGWIRGKVAQIYNYYRDKFTAIKDFIVDTFHKIRDKVRDIWDKVAEIVQRAVDKVKGIGEGIWSGLKGVINTGIGLLNAAIRGFNKVIGAVNAVPGVSVPTIPEIPKLAAGGIVQRPTLALVGEAGPEAVVPLSKLDAYVDRKEKPIYLKVQIGERDITDMVQAVNRSERDTLALSLAGGRRIR
jgi:tape measure domain-containing protein